MSTSVSKKPSFSKILDVATDIRLNPEPEEFDKTFLTKLLVQVTLPHSNPGNVPVWSRKNGDFSLAIQQGWDHLKEELSGFPYGSIPRLVLCWITTEVLRKQKRKLILGDSLAQFMRELGLSTSTGGGKRSDAKRLKDQMYRLFKAKISFAQTKEQYHKWLDMQVAPVGELWWDDKKIDQCDIFESWIELGDKFYEAIIESPVPLDKRAIKALKQSPLALDLYAWATHKIFSLNINKKQNQFIPWDKFSMQLGCEYKTLKNFKQKIKKTLKQVQCVYPHLILEDAEGGFIISGKTCIQKTSSKLISFSPKGD